MHQKLWFALSGSSFETKVVDQQDGFTILRLPRQDDHSDDEGEGVPEMAHEMFGQAQSEQMSGHFVSWEIIDAWHAHS